MKSLRWQLVFFLAVPILSLADSSGIIFCSPKGEKNAFCIKNIHVPLRDVERLCNDDDDCGRVFTTCVTGCQVEPEAISEGTRRTYEMRKETHCYENHIGDLKFLDPQTGVLLKYPCSPGGRSKRTLLHKRDDGTFRIPRAICREKRCVLEGSQSPSQKEPQKYK